jgi:hypothetical protein
VYSLHGSDPFPEFMTMTDKQRRVAIVFPADANAGLSTRVERTRFSGIAGALASTGIEAVGAP